VLGGLVAGFGLGGGLGQILALVLISLGLVVATALVFYEVGLSEDRERAREAGEQARSVGHPARSVRPARGRRSQLDRMRGRRRGLR
jgi:hypothetical protein